MAECHCGMCEHCTPTLTQAFPAAKGHYEMVAPELADNARIVAQIWVSQAECAEESCAHPACVAARRILELVGDE